MNWLEFELMIMDSIEESGLRDPEKIRDFSDDLHQHIEIAVQDYCYDLGIEDYEPIY